MGNRTREKEEKIKHLVTNKPNLRVQNGHNSVIWPTHLAYDNDSPAFIGYLMPKASGENLESLCTFKLNQKL